MPNGRRYFLLIHLAQPLIRVVCGGLVLGAVSMQAGGQNYNHSWQYPIGSPAAFHMTGPATQGDPQGNALIESVEMPDGSVFNTFYRPVGISHFSYSGAGNKFSAHGGSNCTIGYNSALQLKDVDGQGGKKPSAADIAGMPAHILAVLENQNLNNYVDTSTNKSWEFVMEFDLPLKDNDTSPDDFGELLYFERGSGGGNSWLTFMAVDENNNPLPGAEPLSISPAETVDTTPWTVLRLGQRIGAVAIDLSRLGVSETSHLRVTKAQPGVGGYTNGERRPDFKVMAVITHPSQLSSVAALFD